MNTAEPTGTRLGDTTSVRLNRRGRFLLHGVPVIVLSVMAAVAALVLATTAIGPATASAQRAAEPATVTVDYGDTLWAIAERVAPGQDRFTTLEQIGALNDLEGSELQPGQVLFVPRAG